MPADYTRGEKARRARLIVKGGRAAMAGASTASVDRQLDRLEQRGEQRWQARADAARALVDRLRTEAAHAKAVERAAPRKDRGPLTSARKQAEAALRRAENAARKYR